MNIFSALILGIVEGITEFLPISSTAHLILTSQLLGIKQTAFISFFEVFIQSGAILAVIFLYWRFIIKNKSYVKYLLVSFIPTALVGFILYNAIKTIFFNSLEIILFSLVSVGLLFIILERHIAITHLQGVKGLHNRLFLNKSISQINYYHAFVIGLIQSVAVIPGISRAGAVIIVMLFLGYKRKDAAIYSFLLAVPTIMAAGIFDLYKTDWQIINQPNNLSYIIIGFISSFITAYISIKWLIRYLQTNNLILFGIYRIVISVVFLTARLF